MANDSLHTAKNSKNDEWYTQYSDIEEELNAYIEYNKDVFVGKTILCPCDDPDWSNFTKYFAAKFNDLKLKKLICTSYALSSGSEIISECESSSPLFDPEYRKTHGKLYILEKKADRKVNHNDISWTYLEGDGDFRSDEVTRLRDEADVIITNPPFSMSREFLAWIMEGNCEFIILSSVNSITYKEFIPLIKNNTIWLGNKNLNKDMYFTVTDEYKEWLVKHKKEGSAYKVINGVVMGRLASACWLTNLDHGKRHDPLQLMTMAENLRYNKRLKNRLKEYRVKPKYPKYDNFDALEVPFTEAIPSDYKPCWLSCEKAEECPYARDEGMTDAKALCDNPVNGLMGVPITYLDKHCSDQFEIIGFWNSGSAGKELGAVPCPAKSKDKDIVWNGPTVNHKTLYFRMIIRAKI